MSNHCAQLLQYFSGELFARTLHAALLWLEHFDTDENIRPVYICLQRFVVEILAYLYLLVLYFCCDQQTNRRSNVTSADHFLIIGPPGTHTGVEVARRKLRSSVAVIQIRGRWLSTVGRIAFNHSTHSTVTCSWMYIDLVSVTRQFPVLESASVRIFPCCSRHLNSTQFSRLSILSFYKIVSFVMRTSRPLAVNDLTTNKKPICR